MMLGGGLLPDGGLPEWVVRRLEGARHLYMQQPTHPQKQQQQAYAPAAVAGAAGSTPGATPPAADWRQPEAGAAAAAAAQSGCPIVLLGAGTPHKPAVVDAAGFVLHESTAYAAYLVRRGVPAAHLLKEACSYDTVGNGYFSLLIHALPAGWRCARALVRGCSWVLRGAGRTQAACRAALRSPLPLTATSASSKQFQHARAIRPTGCTRTGSDLRLPPLLTLCPFHPPPAGASLL